MLRVGSVDAPDLHVVVDLTPDELATALSMYAEELLNDSFIYSKRGEGEACSAAYNKSVRLSSAAASISEGVK